jgi:RNA polymerase sigma-70 factor (ECF subfamily)
MTALELNHRITNLKEGLQYLAISLTANQDDANDLIQDTYLKVFSNKDKFDPSTNLKAWVYTIMRNTFINKYRKATRFNKIMENNKETFYSNNALNTSHNDPDTQYNKSEIEKAISELKDDIRIPFEMHFQGYKYKEIAEKLDLSIGTVKSRIFFSRKSLMEKLHDYKY